MTLLAGAASFFVGNAYSSQMPGFAQDLGHGDPGLSYSMLLAADACGAFLAGVLLEERRTIAAAAAHRHRAGHALVRFACRIFAVVELPARARPVVRRRLLRAVVQRHGATLVQINAPLEIRGRVIGLFNMASYGLRAFSGVSVGLLGSLIGVHWSLAASALAMLATAAALLALP